MAKSAMARAPEKSIARRGAFPSPFAMMRSFNDEMDRVFGDFGLTRRWPFNAFTPEGEEALWAPEVEVEQKEGKLIVRADLPGLTKNDVKVEITDDSLTLEGERKHEAEKKGEGYYRSERYYGHFRRSLALPEGVKADTAKASFKDGVLEITLEAPAPPEAAARRVEIQ